MKRFSIEQAERLIPLLSPLILRAQQLKQQLETYEEVTLRKRLRTDGSYDFETLDTEHTALKESFYTTIEEITAHGCIVRDVEEGLIDFPTRFEGRDVFLSWRLGERRITHWHEADDELRKRILEF